MGKSKILIAEDLESNYLLLKIILSTKYEVIWAKNGKEAVDLFNECEPDLILMDIRMPVMDGYEATKIIRTISTSIPIIAQTAHAFESDRQKALGVGFTNVITKPIKIDFLHEMVEKYL
ncbi:MAG: response regulator [Bacteroidales bacterium]|nr:response regulator [Bacteroidales bacterium]MDD4655756.1 response regulator [Bacteroidales bacterium]